MTGYSEGAYVDAVYRNYFPEARRTFPAGPERVLPLRDTRGIHFDGVETPGVNLFDTREATKLSHGFLLRNLSEGIG